MSSIRVTRGGDVFRLPCNDTDTLLALLRRAGCSLPAACGGHGRCGKCRVSVNGVPRLACRVVPEDGDEIVLPPAAGGRILTETLDPPAVPTGETGCAAELKRTVTAGNTVMQSLLAGVSVRPLAAAPFCPETFFRQSSGLTLLDAPLYCVPCAAGFVGGDITAGLLASGLARRAGHFLFLDIGTNGEMALGGMDGFTCCAVAAGPAFEGAGIACGMLGVDGAVSRVRYSDAFKMNVIGGGEAVGLCGSGLIDLTALLLRLGVIDESGRLLPPEDAPEAFRRYLTRDENGCGVFHLTDRVYLTAADVRALQLAKAAVAAGVQILLAQQGLTLSALDGLYLSGGFGMYLDPASAAAIGMLPRLPAAKLHSVGNAALSGAAQLALRGDMSAADGIVNRLTYLELSGRPDFADAFAKNIPLRPMQWR